jgi:transposase InsO family protein
VVVDVVSVALLSLVLHTKTMIGLNDKGEFRFRKAATGAGEVTRRKLPVVEKEDLTEWSNQSLNQVLWTKEKIQALRRDYTGITEKDGKYYLGDRRIVLANEDVTPILKEEFKAIPPSTGILRWYSLLIKDYVGLRRQDVIDFLKDQSLKQRYAGLKKPSGTKTTVPKSPGAKWQIDFAIMGDEWRNERFPQIFTAVDTYSKYLFAIPLAKQDGDYQVRGLEALLKHLEDIGAPKPRLISSDNGFNNEEFRAALDKYNIKGVFARSYNPQANGSIERANRTLKQALTSYADAKGTKKSWSDKEILDQVLAVLNTSYHRNLGMGRSPYSVLTGKEPDQELSSKLKKEAESRRNYKLYIKGAIPEGTAVKVSMRVDGPSGVKDAIKSGIRKGYLPSFTDEVWRVRLRRGNLYWLVDKEGNKREGAVDRAELLALPSDAPKNAWRKPPTVTVDDEPTPPPKETVRIRVKAPPKPAYDGPDKDLINKEFQENDGGWRYRVIRIRTLKDGTRVGDYRRVLRDGGLKGKTLYQTVEELRAYPPIGPV